MSKTRRHLSIAIVGDTDKKQKFISELGGSSETSDVTWRFDDTTVTITDRPSYDAVDSIVRIVPMKKVPPYEGEKNEEKIEVFDFAFYDLSSYLKHLVAKKYQDTPQPEIEKSKPITTPEMDTKKKEEPVVTQESKVEKQEPVVIQASKEKKKKPQPSLFDDFKRLVHDLGGPPKPPTGGFSIN